jgi:hypothetical protein
VATSDRCKIELLYLINFQLCTVMMGGGVRDASVATSETASVTSAESGWSAGGRPVPQAVVLESAFRFTSEKEKNAFYEQKRHEKAWKERSGGRLLMLWKVCQSVSDQGTLFVSRARERAVKRQRNEAYRVMMSAKMRALLEQALGIQVASIRDCARDDFPSDLRADVDRPWMGRGMRRTMTRRMTMMRRMLLRVRAPMQHS